MGMTAAVYGAFRFLLPLVIPFLIAFLLSRLVKPAVDFFNEKWKIRKSITASLCLFVLLGIFLILIIWLGRNLLDQFYRFTEQLPFYTEQVDAWIRTCCRDLEQTFHLEKDYILNAVYRGSGKITAQLQEEVLPYMMDHSVDITKALIEVGAGFFIVVISSVLILLEEDNWKKRVDNSVFSQEILGIYRCLKGMGGSWLKVQGIIMLLTTLICVAGLWIMKNEYALLAGVVIGVLDALPVFGTGTVFIPWIVIEVFMGEYWQAAGLLVLYGICYVLREVLEAKLMGNRIGISSLEMVMSVVIGVKLFGFLGFITGPAAYLILKEIHGWIKTG